MAPKILRKENEKIIPEVFSKRIRPKPSIVYDTYWKFAAERQEIFFKRASAEKFPWTGDPILGMYKFTNAYRASDRVSQYLIRNVIYSGDQKPHEVFFRILLFKLFNKIETWEEIKKEVGEMSYGNYNYKTYNKILDSLKVRSKSIYSGAYIMASASVYGHRLKHQNHLRLLEDMMSKRFPLKLEKMKSMEALYSEFLKYPSIGPFLAYQFSIDINYSTLTDFSEMEFVKAGPGALDGIRKCFSSIGDYTEEDVIKMMAENQSEEFKKRELKFKTLWGRPLQLIDCQNLFCEVDKYARIAHPTISGVSDRKRIKQTYKQNLRKKIDYFFPEKWHLDYDIK